MIKNIKYRRVDDIDFIFSINKRGAVGFQDSSGETSIFSSSYGGHSLVRIGEWLAECSNNCIFVKNMAAENAGQGHKLDINFQEGDAVVTLKYMDQDGVQKSEDFAGTTLLTTDGKKLTIHQAESAEASPDPRVQRTGPSRTQRTVQNETRNSQQDTQNAEKLAALEKKAAELEKKNKKLEKEKKELEKSRKELCQEMESVKETNASLQTALEKRVEDHIGNLSRIQDRLSESLSNKLEEATKAEALCRQKQEEIQNTEQERNQLRNREESLNRDLEQLQEELEGLRSTEELRTLDCEKARAELKELGEQLAYDEDTMMLMSQESFLKFNSVNATIEEVHKKLEAIEKRMGLIISIREKINNTVQDAIVLAGDGRIPAEAETGG